jgi:hypothetical protein
MCCIGMMRVWVEWIGRCTAKGANTRLHDFLSLLTLLPQNMNAVVNIVLRIPYPSHRKAKFLNCSISSLNKWFVSP